MRALHVMNGATRMVAIRSRRLSIVRAAMMPGTAHANEESIGVAFEETTDIEVLDPSDLAILQAHLSTDPKAAPATARCLSKLLGGQR